MAAVAVRRRFDRHAPRRPVDIPYPPPRVTMTHRSLSAALASLASLRSISSGAHLRRRDGGGALPPPRPQGLGQRGHVPPQGAHHRQLQLGQQHLPRRARLIGRWLAGHRRPRVERQRAAIGRRRSEDGASVVALTVGASRERGVVCERTAWLCAVVRRAECGARGGTCGARGGQPAQRQNPTPVPPWCIPVTRLAEPPSEVRERHRRFTSARFTRNNRGSWRSPTERSRRQPKEAAHTKFFRQKRAKPIYTPAGKPLLSP